MGCLLTYGANFFSDTKSFKSFSSANNISAGVKPNETGLVCLYLNLTGVSPI